MAKLPDSTKEAFRAIKEALRERIQLIEGSGKVWKRVRYADNLQQWLDIAAVEKVGQGEVLRIVLIYLAGFTRRQAEARQREITATFGVEVIHGYQDGTDEDNSTEAFEDFIGEIDEHLKTSDTLGFTDQSGNEVSLENISFNDENQGKPLYVDGVLSHRVTGSIEVKFRLCNF